MARYVAEKDIERVLEEKKSFLFASIDNYETNFPAIETVKEFNPGAISKDQVIDLLEKEYENYMKANKETIQDMGLAGFGFATVDMDLRFKDEDDRDVIIAVCGPKGVYEEAKFAYIISDDFYEAYTF